MREVVRAGFGVAVFLQGCLLGLHFEQAHTRSGDDGSAAATGDMNGADGPSGATGPTSPTNIVVLPTGAAGPTCAFGVADSSAPVLFFSDLQSGPSSGGENDLGVFVTLYGLRFGSDRGSSTVSFGGGEVGRYVAWNPPDSHRARGLEAIVVQLGANTQSGDILVQVGGRTSNPLPFTVREGTIFLVDLAAGTNGDGSFASPWNTLYSARSPNVTDAGSTIYVKNGNFSTEDPSGSNDHQFRFLLDATTAINGTDSAPIAYVGYPGAPPTLSTDTNDTTAVVMLDRDNYTLANFHFAVKAGGPGPAAISIAVGSGGKHQRLVGNWIDQLGRTGVPWFKLGATTGLTLLGNLWTASEEVAICGNGGAATAAELGWNEVIGPVAAAAFDFDCPLESVRVHDNHLDQNAQLTGQPLIRVTDQMTGVAVYNNIFAGAVAYSVQIATDDVAGLALTHNTFLKTAPAALALSSTGPTGLIDLVDNIVTLTGSTSVVAGDAAHVSASHNAYESDSGNVTNAPSGAQQIFDQDPSLSAVTYKPGLGSAVLHAGVSTSIGSDYNGVCRSDPPDLGAVSR